VIKSIQEIYLVKTKVMNSKKSDISLPSNKKFGYFFGIIFFVLGIYFLFKETQGMSWLFLFLGGLFILTASYIPIILLPLNKLWFKLGLLLSKIVNPIIIGIIFFIVVSPIAILANFTGRDELRLKKSTKNTFWIDKKESSHDQDFFRKQF